MTLRSDAVSLMEAMSRSSSFSFAYPVRCKQVRLFCFKVSQKCFGACVSFKESSSRCFGGVGDCMEETVNK